MKISQSLLKGLLDYENGEECGIVFKAKYIDSKFDLFPPSDTQNLGAWFEYMATGSIPKNGAIPKPQTIKGVDKDGNPNLAADYRLMMKHLPNFKRTMEGHGFEILQAGEDIKAYYPNSKERFGFDVWLTGTLDLRVRALKDVYGQYNTENNKSMKVKVMSEGEMAIADIKVSGLLSDPWHKFGWHLSRLHEKVKLTTQPIHYKLIETLNGKPNPPFMFILFAPKDEHDYRMIDFRVDDSAFDEHKAWIDMAIPILKLRERTGYEARPTPVRCGDCPLRDGCSKKVDIAPIDVFYFAKQI